MKLKADQYYVLSGKPYLVIMVTETGAHVKSLVDSKQFLINEESAVEIISEYKAKKILQDLKTVAK